jgi:hypothetical protein
LVATDPATERERERERACFFSVAGDRSGFQIYRREDAGQQRRPTAKREAAEKDGNYLRYGRCRAGERERGNLPERDENYTEEKFERERKRGAALEGK